jgi:taurine dioxygenase
MAGLSLRPLGKRLGTEVLGADLARLDDATFAEIEKLPRLAILVAVEVPREKGGTIFADMYAAYETLPEATKQKLAGMTGRHGYTDGPDSRRIYTAEHIRERNAGRPEALHPAVKAHPVTGRKVLFVNPTHCHGFVGMTNDESEPLIEELRDHSVQEDNTYYHKWRVGDVLIWDEIATMHRGAADAAPEERRVMLRTIVHPN